MATTGVSQVNRGFRWIKGSVGYPEILEMPMVLSVSYYTGNLLALSYTSGSVKLAVEADTTLFGVCAHSITAPAAGDKIQVIPLRSDYVWEVYASQGMSGSRWDNLVGRKVDHEIQTATYHRIDTGASTNMFIIVGGPEADRKAAFRSCRYWVRARPTISIAEDADYSH